MRARRTMAAILTGALLVLGGVAQAAPPAESVRVEQPWIRWLPANLPAAGYVKITNDSGAETSLTGASSPVFRSVTLMRSRLDEDDSTMVTVTRIDVPAHGSTSLAPGGYHLMLMGAVHPIKPGDRVPMTLRFADGSSLHADFSVLPANASGP